MDKDLDNVEFDLDEFFRYYGFNKKRIAELMKIPNSNFHTRIKKDSKRQFEYAEWKLLHEVMKEIGEETEKAKVFIQSKIDSFD